MGYFQHVVTRSDGPESYVSGVSALALHSTAAGLRLFSASGIQGGLLQRNPSLGLSVAAAQSYASLPAAAGSSAGGRSAVAGLSSRTPGADQLWRHRGGARLLAGWPRRLGAGL